MSEVIHPSQGILVPAPTAAAPATPTVAAGHHRPSPRKRAEQRFAWFLIIPTVLGVGLFTAAPILASFALSFFNYSIINAPKWIGLANYDEMLHDSAVQHAFVVTICLAVAIVVVQIVVGLGLAISVQRRMKWARPLYRAAFFVPLLVSGASISIVMSYIFDDRFGVLNYYLSKIGLPLVPWLGSSAGAFATIVLVVVWQQLGFTFIVFSAALGAVPQELLEAATVDGAGFWVKFKSVTLPMISPSVLFTATVGIINALQLFDQAYILTSGGPGNATQTVVLTIYQQAFESLHFGYASSISVVLFVVVLIATYLQFKISRKWVFYA